MTTFTATYSPDDNKLRLVASSRLDAETYARVKAAGYKWAPRLEQFIAPMWTPEREDLALELAGEIGDEDSSLMDRAEDRAGRFEGYQERRAADAERAHQAAARLMDGIPLGQPILVGHHSERHARRDAERIESGIRRAVNAWKTSEYWKHRAAAAVAHAKYKERPDVRARRIKGLEAEQRAQEKIAKQSRSYLALWEKLHEPDSISRKDGATTTFKERALHVANGDPGLGYGVWSDLDGDKVDAAGAQARAIAAHRPRLARAERWLEHLAFRLEYERAMLAADGGTVAQRTGPEKGGGCRCWASPRGGWSYIQKVNKVSVTVLDNWGNGGRNFTRTIPFDKLASIMTAAEVAEKRVAGLLVDTADGLGFFLLDAAPAITPTPRHEPEPAEATFRALGEQLKAGVQVVSAPQLFPTPPDLARRMAELAGPTMAGMRVLEPSAGTGNLVRAIRDSALGFDGGVRVVAVEVSPQLCTGLEEQRSRTAYATPSNFEVRCADFLTCNGDLGMFDRVLMNPPFAGAADVEHIRHAVGFLRPGGVLVALCANGPRQREALLPLADYWEDLPAGSFKAAGTGVNAALLVIRR